MASLIPLGTILFTPVFGSIVDRKGKAASLMILGAVLLIFAHLSLSIFNSVALGYAGLLSLGIAFSLPFTFPFFDFINPTTAINAPPAIAATKTIMVGSKGSSLPG